MKKIVLVNSHYSPMFCQVLTKSAGPRYKAFKSDTPAKILPYEFIHGQVSPATLKEIVLCICMNFYVVFFQKALHDWSRGKQWILFPENLDQCFPGRSRGKHRDSREKN